MCLFLGIVSGYDDDIESADDLYDVIGTMLEGLDSNMEDDTIREICRLLHNTRLKYAWLFLVTSAKQEVVR